MVFKANETILIKSFLKVTTYKILQFMSPSLQPSIELLSLVEMRLTLPDYQIEMQICLLSPHCIHFYLSIFTFWACLWCRAHSVTYSNIPQHGWPGQAEVTVLVSSLSRSQTTNKVDNFSPLSHHDIFTTLEHHQTLLFKFQQFECCDCRC